MGNLAGVLVILGGVFLVVVGLRGTQGAVFPNLFPSASGTSGTRGSGL